MALILMQGLETQKGLLIMHYISSLSFLFAAVPFLTFYKFIKVIKSQTIKNDKLTVGSCHVSLSSLNIFFFSLQEILVCGHSLEVNITTNLDFFLSVAQAQLLHQLIVANMTGLEPSDKGTEVTGTWFSLSLMLLYPFYIHSKKTIIRINAFY